MQQLAFVDSETIRLVERAKHGKLSGREILGKTVVSLVSPGTELNWSSLTQDFPFFPGYASVFETVETGPEVHDVPPGTLMFSHGPHAESQVYSRENVIPLPSGLAPDVAVFARLAAISMTTLSTTAARPPARVLITGLGPVGNLASQIFKHCGYEVTASDPVPARRDLAKSMGLRDVRETISGDSAQDLDNEIVLHLECSGHEQAALDGCRLIRQLGEVVLLGVPWRKRSEIPAFDLLHAVFHRYARLRSGWEWEIPVIPQAFHHTSIRQNTIAALQWLADGHLCVTGLADLYSPHNATGVYDGLRQQTLRTPGAIFDWRQL